MDAVLSRLLTGAQVSQAIDFFDAFTEKRTTSWAEADLQAKGKAASLSHIPELRGQLRHHLGEEALKASAEQAGLATTTMRSAPAGGVFQLARIGRFALSSVKTNVERGRLRPAVTRELLARANHELDPQSSLLPPEPGSATVHEIAYFGCLAAVPTRRDPMVPSILALGVPDVSMRHWLFWIPLPMLAAKMRGIRETGVAPKAEPEQKDAAFPTLLLPKKPGSSSGTTGSV